MGYSAVESFCGAGGLSLGLAGAGFDVAYAFDANAPAVRTHQANLPHLVEVADAGAITARAILGRARVRKGRLDLFSGGPPCQGFSKQKRGAHLGDARNALVLHFIRLVDALAPRFFLLENVAVFGHKRGKAYLDAIHARLPGYRLYPHFYNCADYGLAQTRQRFIVVGQRADLRTPFAVPPPLGSPRRTVGDVLQDLPEPPENYSEHPHFANHQNARVTPINVARFSHVPQGGGWQDIPEALRLKCHRDANVKKGGWPDVYGRLRWDGQCPTITGGFDSFTRGRYGHPLHDRPLTPREAARIQGFPDTFRFMGTRGDVRAQIGNAVPPPLARIIGASIFECLREADKPSRRVKRPATESRSAQCGGQPPR